MGRMISFYNEQVAGFVKVSQGKPKAELSDVAEMFIDTDPRRISWSRGLKNDLTKYVSHSFQINSVNLGVYRPFNKQLVYHDRHMNELLGLMPQIFPKAGLMNLVIAVSGMGAARDFSALVTDCIPNFHLHDTGQCFPLFL